MTSSILGPSIMILSSGTLSATQPMEVVTVSK